MDDSSSDEDGYRIEFSDSSDTDYNMDGYILDLKRKYKKKYAKKQAKKLAKKKNN